MSEVEVRTVVVHERSGVSGILSFIFGLLSIFVLAPLFVPLALICAVISIFSTSGQWVWGLFGTILAIAGAVTSPTFWVIFGLAATASAT